MAISFEPRYYLRDNKTGGKPADVAVMTASAGKAGDNAPHIAVAISNPPALCVNIEHALHATGNPYSIKLSDVSEAITRSECNMHTAVLVPTASQPALAVQEDKQNGVMLSDTSGSLRSNAPGSQPCGTLALTFGEVISFKPGQSEAAGGFFATVGFAPTLQSVNNGSTAVPVVAFPCGEHALHAMGFDAYNQKATGDVTHPLRVGLGNGNGDEIPQALIVAPTLTSANNPSRSPQSAEITQQVNAVYAATMQVRRLSPLECERLQGFPDGWTDIPYKNSKGSPDGPRYKALGNSMAVNVMRFIGERIQLVST
jgi:DNA (cytosine-5)-methyltransferase 1